VHIIIIIISIEIGDAGFAEGKLGTGAISRTDAIPFVAVVVCGWNSHQLSISYKATTDEDQGEERTELVAALACKRYDACADGAAFIGDVVVVDFLREADG
jgi:hypothetical protein